MCSARAERAILAPPTPPTPAAAPKPPVQLQHHGHSWAWETGPRGRTWADSHSPEPWGQGSQRPRVRLGQHQAARSLWRARPEVSSGPAGSEEETEAEAERRRIKGSQRPQQVQGPSREEPSQSAWYGRPSAKTPRGPQGGPAWVPATLTIPGSFRIW